MANQQNLPENDLDLLLARSLGKALDSNAKFSELDSSLIDQLVDFKNSELHSYETIIPASNAIWEAIELKTHPRAKVLPFYQRPIAYTWAAAAVLLIATFVGFYWISLNPEPQLIAQTDSLITTFVLDDGTEVTLRPYSELYEVAYSKTERSYSLNGEAYFDVTSDASRPFSVKAGEGTITVLGTRFNLSNWGNSAKVFLEEGSVRLTASNQASVLLKPGETSEINQGILLNPEASSADEFLDWISNTIVFSNSIPNEVVAEIGQHFNIYIDISQLDNQTGLDGTLRLDTISQTLEDLGIVFNGTFRKISDNEYIFISTE